MAKGDRLWPPLARGNTMADTNGLLARNFGQGPLQVNRPKPPYVDGLHGKHYFGASNDLVDCGHMSGLSMRSICPLALMESDYQDPIM